VRTAISGPTTVDQIEKEFAFEKPFTPAKQVNDICLAYVQRLEIKNVTDPPRFLDKTPWKLGMYLIASDGTKYAVDTIGRNRENYLCLHPRDYEEWLRISEKGVSFVKLSIQSNRKIDLTRIEWESYNAWDFK
jgi:hypothetical protein